MAVHERRPAGTGWDYLGEPTPYYSSRSSSSGVIDLAGFKKDRFYLYQAHWRPDHRMAHLLPHWTWPERVGEVTPVHVFTSGDEAELFLNGRSLGRTRKAPFEYRMRWDSVEYEPGTLEVVAYKHGKRWATDVVKTAGWAKIVATARKGLYANYANDGQCLREHPNLRGTESVIASLLLHPRSASGAGTFRGRNKEFTRRGQCSEAVAAHGVIRANQGNP